MHLTNFGIQILYVNVAGGGGGGGIGQMGISQGFVATSTANSAINMYSYLLSVNLSMLPIHTHPLQVDVLFKCWNI